MSHRPPPRLPDRPRPRIEVMRHLSAPIDDHRLIPYPSRRRWEKAILVAVTVAAATAALAFFFLRATALR